MLRSGLSGSPFPKGSLRDHLQGFLASMASRKPTVIAAVVTVWDVDPSLKRAVKSRTQLPQRALEATSHQSQAS